MFDLGVWETQFAIGRAAHMSGEEMVRGFKKRMIEHYLMANGGNQCKTARDIGWHRNTLSRQIADLKIEVPSRRKPMNTAPLHPRWKRTAHKA